MPLISQDSTLTVLYTQQHHCSIPGNIFLYFIQKTKAPSPIASPGDTVKPGALSRRSLISSRKLLLIFDNNIQLKLATYIHAQ